MSASPMSPWVATPLSRWRKGSATNTSPTPLELSAREDWPELDRYVRLIFQLTHGDPEDDSLMAENLLEVCERLRRRRDT